MAFDPVSYAMGTKASGGSSGLTSDIKDALLQIAAKVAYIDGNGELYYGALENALLNRSVLSISAVFTQGSSVYGTNTPIDDLKSNLVVTAAYSDGTTKTLADVEYTLAGTMQVGTSTITVSYIDKTTTFTVAVDYLIVVYGSELLRQVGLTSSPPYYDTSTKTRISYTNYDLLIPGGKTYIVKGYATTDTSSPRMGVQWFNQTALNAVAASSSYNSSNNYDPGWQTSYESGVITATLTIPAAQNNSPIVGTRMTFSLESNVIIPDDFVVTLVTIEESV